MGNEADGHTLSNQTATKKFYPVDSVILRQRTLSDVVGSRTCHSSEHTQPFRGPQALRMNKFLDPVGQFLEWGNGRHSKTLSMC